MKKNYKLLPPIIPSAKIDKEYRNALFALIDQMQRSVEWYCKAAFKPVEKEQVKLGMLDADPVNNLQRVINAVKKRYIKRFNELAGKLPKEVVEKIAKEVKRKIKSHLIDVMTVELKFSKAEKMLLNALTKENVSLIKSIPQEYFKRVEYDIMSTVSEGRDMQDLSDKLSKGYGITRRRAITIAYDQTNKITEQFERAEKIELGLFQAEWKHSHASQEPRPGHLKADGKTYDIRKGCYIDGEYIHPAQKINCYHKDTEVYTKRGFIRFPDLLPDDKILSLNPVTKNVEWVCIEHFVKKHIENILCISGRDLYMNVDENHVFYGAWRVDTGKGYILKEGFIKGFNNVTSQFKVYKSCKWKGENKDFITIGKTKIPTKDYCLLMGYYLSEGSVDIRPKCYRVSIAQRKHREKMLKDLAFFKPHLNKQEIAFYSKDISYYLAKFGYSYQKYIPQEIKELPKEYIRIFLEAYCLGDGTPAHARLFKGNNVICYNRYYTSSKKMASDLAECIIKTGMAVSIKEGNQKGKQVKFNNGTYTLNHNIFFVNEKKNVYSNFRSCKKTLENYNDFVYDVELSKNHIMLVKFKESVFWGSNCNCFSRTILPTK